jgi:hypothetical protein
MSKSDNMILDTEVTPLEAAKLLAEQREALAASMLYEYRLNELGKEFASRNLAPVIVKGQAIVDLAFPKDEIRLSGDIDLLVGDDGDQVATALKAIGYEENAPHSRHFPFGERGFYQNEQRLPDYVEVHRCLDKILLRPIPYVEILARATPSGRAGFRYPAIEDLFLLVVLHASADIFFDPERIQRDLRFLIDHGKPDMEVVWTRAQQWELSHALRRLLSGRYPQEVSPSSTWSASKTGTYLMGQLLWHDRLLTLLRGLGRYSLARLRDRLSR